MSVPQPTSSQPEPTEQSQPKTTMPPPPSSLPLTLILAATPSLGIGRAGTLPWPQLKQEMAYFARVTKRVAAPLPHPSSSQTFSHGDVNKGDGQEKGQEQGKKRMNAVIMGRKTWDSIPEKFRPLKGRVNVVVTRGVGGVKWGARNGDGGGGEGVEEGPIVVGSVRAGIDALLHSSSSSSSSSSSDQTQTQTQSQTQSQTEIQGRLHPNVSISRVFVIGGSTIYSQALGMEECERVLLTKIKEEYECDTFFGIDLEGEEGRGKGWVKRG